ncbi:chloramphenicol-sensitive protein RarD [Chishuiella changwenlii]|uniref:Chloramphenicol-sensitive protein RarD n=1 Tax=Chishuiella changwenlii TaxID=1434701 RepID=A0A1M6T1N5_9FLAO|nr:EamA family transporter [Chishuiella changwenlii]GGE94593.1 permease [Chishuiella changwenlii]SHK50902.1 chloramphenicol-sensitive protein RarD [Chishuiella changwenlii]
MKQSNYIFAAIITYLMWGFFSFGLKPIASYPPLDILFFRLYVSVFFLVIINVSFRRKKIKQDWQLFSSLEKKQRNKLATLIIGGSLILMTNWLSFIIVMNNISVQAASLSYLVCPIITTVLAFVILKEQLTKVKWLAVIISLLACGILSIGHFIDLFYSLIVACSFALYIIIQRSLKIFDSFNLLMTQLLIVAVLMLPLVFTFAGEIPKEPIFYRCIMMIVVMFTIIPMFLNNFALKGIDSSTVGVLIYLNPITNFLLAIFYYKESISFVQIMGYSLIFIAIFVFNIQTIYKLTTNRRKVL